MVEQWKKVTKGEEETEENIIYEITDSVVIKKVSKQQLLEEKTHLESELLRVNADLQKIAELEE